MSLGLALLVEWMMSIMLLLRLLLAAATCVCAVTDYQAEGGG
jgi:hypothetical protein